MPHQARRISGSGYYHVVPKGVANRILFGDDEDKTYYLDLLLEAKSQSHVRIHAYCLMSNHVHLVVEDEHGLISQTMKYVDERYAMYYANKVGRLGGVFRKPFWSEPIEDDARLLCAVRYTHNNPAAAGLCKASQYPWSSVRDYLGTRSVGVAGVADTDVVLGLLGGRRGFIEFSNMASATAHPFEGSKLRGHLDDDEAVRLATYVLGHDPRTATTTEELGLLKHRGFNIRQIERITGCGKNQVFRA